MPHYLILDGARLETRMSQGMGLNEHHQSLYRGALDSDLEAVGPYLFNFPHSGEFCDWFVEKGLGDHWGILAESEQPFDKIYNHFRRFLTVRTEDDVQLYFRFYDPRVLRIFLPTCDKQQLKEFFGPVRKYIVEAENPAYILIFHLGPEGDLQTEQAEADAFFGSPDFEPASASNPPALTLPSGVPAADTGASKRKWRFLTEDDSPPQS